MQDNERLSQFKSIGEIHSLLFDVMDDGVIIINHEGLIIECNPAFHQRLGYHKQEIIGKRVAELDTPEFAPKVSQRINDIISKGRAVFETAHYRKDGSIMPVEISARIVYVDGEQRLISIVRDISERKHLDIALQDKERRYNALVETSADGFWVADSQGCFIEVNDAYLKRSGYSREEFLNMRIPDIEATETSDETRRHLAKIISKGHDRFETWHRTKSGELWPVEIVTTFYPFNGGTFMVFAIDISERNRAQQEIAVQQKELSKLSQALQQAGEGIMITSTDATIEYINQSFTDITGYSAQDLIGKDTSILKSEAQDPSVYRELWQTISRGKIWEGGLIDRRKDGSFFPILLSIAPIIDEDGEIIHFVSIMKDVTELKKLEQQLLQAQKMESMGTLVGGIAHDFNNMLAALQGNVFLATRNLGDQQVVGKRLQIIHQLVSDASGVVKQLLTFAKKDIVEIEAVELNTLIKDVFKLAKSTIPENIDRSLHLSDEMLPVNADKTQLQQVMINLSNNARDALEKTKQPKIEWRLHKYQATPEFKKSHPEAVEEHFARITIRDNGCGIKQIHLEAIFDPFFTTKEPGKGTGLGLAMVFGSIERHGGVLDVESDIGKGTAFHIYLPLIQAAVVNDSIPPSFSIQGNAETILLVDDEDNLRDTTSEVLQGLGYQVIEACDGDQALRLYLEHHEQIELILSDIVMPGMGGVELAREIRKLNDNIPIILATGYDRALVTSGNADISNCHVLSKPYSFEAASQMISRMLSKQ
ncbi:PAS domain S-box protein [Mariprofundus ferrooxydans]|uniref:PAS domain-containing hybrid sensor histidine kinase/response regulator n=1 Tax=Mariprofundus ferrooxydans TaxID=314344 RepID=UPI000380B868|nr:PAS domain S-box protein [Mariprofundus ferrooxydans]